MELNTWKDFEGLIMTMAEPLKKFYSGKNKLNIGNTSAGYEENIRGTEAFIRPLWGFIPLWKNSSEQDFYNRYIDGIVCGTDKDNLDYWGDCHDCDQRYVEMAAIAYWLLINPDNLLSSISERQKKNLFDWLLQINNSQVVNNNWIMFRILINAAMKKHNYEYSSELLEDDWKRIDSFYTGDGWYIDGCTKHKDYYIPFAIHFYSLIYAIGMKDIDVKRVETIRNRAMLFAKEFIYWFDDNGEALAYGRSLTYRFAQVAFWGICLVADLQPFSVGVIKGLIVRNLKCWLENALIFDNAGILTIGYKYPNLVFAEHYNAPGSPYWAFKAFAFMALDKNHEFWSCEAEPLPTLKTKKVLDGAEMYITRSDAGNVYAFPKLVFAGGDGQNKAKYYKFAYSTLHGFSVAYSNERIEECAPDSTLAFEVDGYIFTIRDVENTTIDDEKITIKWSPFMGIDVKTTIIPNEFGHKRIHEINSQYNCIAYDCGYSVACRDTDGFYMNLNDGYTEMYNNFQYCRVEGQGASYIDAVPNTNIMYSKTKIPALKVSIKKGINSIKTQIYHSRGLEKL